MASSLDEFETLCGRPETAYWNTSPLVETIPC